MVDVLSNQLASIATAQDLQNDRLTTGETQISDLRQATDVCTLDLDNKLAAQATAIEEIKAVVQKLAEEGPSGQSREMRLIDDKTKVPNTFTGNRKQWKSWQRSVKAHLNAKYHGARKVLTWVERMEEKPTQEDMRNTQWKHIVEFNTRLYDMLISYTELEPQGIIENMDPDEGLACWRKLVQY